MVTTQEHKMLNGKKIVFCSTVEKKILLLISSEKRLRLIMLRLSWESKKV